MMIGATSNATVGFFALLLVCTICARETESLFREEQPHQESGDGKGVAATEVAGTAYTEEHAGGIFHLLFHEPNFRNGDESEASDESDEERDESDESSASSSEPGKENTTSDSKPSSTNDSSFKGSRDDSEEEKSSKSSSEPGKENTTSDSKPSSTNDSSFPQDKSSDSSGSSSGKGESDSTSDSMASSENDSSVEDKENDDPTDDNNNSTTTDNNSTTTDNNSTTTTNNNTNAKAETCTVPTNGNFGATNSGGRGLQFFYQMETPSSGSDALVNDILLPLVEAGIAGRLLSLLFARCRNETTERRWLRRSLQASNNDTCEAIGFSNLPIDRVLPGVECVGERVDSTDNCFVVDGGARLYFEADACADAVNRSKAELKKAMDSGVFNSLERRIVKVTYVEESDLELSVNDKTAQGEGSSGNDALPSWAWGIIGAGGFIFLLLCAFVCSRRRSKEEDEMSTPLDRGNVDYQPPPSDHENPYFDNDPRRSVESQLLTRTDDSAIPQMEETSGEDTD